MKRLVSCVVALLCLSASVAMAEVKIWNDEEMKASGKIINSGEMFRDTALQPFNPASNAMKGVVEELNSKGVANAYVGFNGQIFQKNGWGVQGTYQVVEAYAFELLEPSVDSVKLVMNKNNVNVYDYRIAVDILAKSKFGRDMAPYLLDKVNNPSNISNNDELLSLVLNAYIDIMKHDGVDELVKVLKNNRNAQVRLIAGKALITLGDRKPVEDYVAQSGNKKSLIVRELTKALAM